MVTEELIPLRVVDGRGAIAPELPEEIYLETTNRCNLRCRTCPQYFGMPEDSADLTPDGVRRILSQFPSVRRVVLHGIGEPLLNRQLPEIIAAAKERDAHVLFNTNGLLLRPPLTEPLVLSGLDELRVSIDSASPETYKLVRGANGFDRIIRNLRRFGDLKAALGSDVRPSRSGSPACNRTSSNCRRWCGSQARSACGRSTCSASSTQSAAWPWRTRRFTAAPASASSRPWRRRSAWRWSSA